MSAQRIFKGMALLLCAIIVALAGCAEPASPPFPSGSPAASTQPTCADRAIRLLDRSGSDIHGAIALVDADDVHLCLGYLGW